MDETLGKPPLLPRAAAASARLLIIALLLAVIGWVIGRFTWVVISLVVALLAASVLTPLVRWLQKHHWKRGLAAFVVELAALGLVGGALALLGPRMVSEVQRQGASLAQQMQQFLQRVLEWLPVGPTTLRGLQERASALLSGQGQAISSVLSRGLITVTELLAGLLLALVLLFFFLRDGPQLAGWLVTRASPRVYRDDVAAAADRGWKALRAYFGGAVLVALVDALGIGLGLVLIGVPLALPLAVLVFFGAFIPVVGAFATGLLAVLVALASGGTTNALLVLGVVVLVQQLEGNVLQPLIMGRAVALHPVVVLLAVTVGGVLAGVAGAFLAVPLAAVASAAGNELRLRREQAA